MRADLDTLLIAVNCMADDLLPCKPRRRRRLRVPGAHDGIVLIDSTPVECGRWVETARRSALAPWCANGYRRSHSRQFWAMPLHGAFGPTARPGRGRSRPPTWASGRWPRPRSPRCSRAARRSSATRATPAPPSRAKSAPSARPCFVPPKGRARAEPAPRPDPPADRVDLSDLQGHPHPRAPRGADDHRPAGAGRVTDAGARRMRIRNWWLGRPTRSLGRVHCMRPRN